MNETNTQTVQLQARGGMTQRLKLDDLSLARIHDIQSAYERNLDIKVSNTVVVRRALAALAEEVLADPATERRRLRAAAQGNL